MRLIVLSILLLPIFCIAQVPQPKPNTYVNDNAGVLGEQQILSLNQQLRALETKYSIQMAIVLVNEFPDGYDAEKFALEIGRTWHVGNANNGMVYVAAIKQHKQRLEVATRVQGTITDVDASEILDGLKPYFRSGKYADGLAAMISDIDKRLTPAQAEQRALVPQTNEESGNSGWWFLLIVPVAGLIGWSIFRRRNDYSITETPIITEDHSSAIGLGSFATGYAAGSLSSRRDDDYTPPPSHSSPSYDSSSYSSSSSSNDSSSFGSWGSDSSSNSSSSSDSGFSGGGSSGDW